MALPLVVTELLVHKRVSSSHLSDVTLGIVHYRLYYTPLGVRFEEGTTHSCLKLLPRLSQQEE